MSQKICLFKGQFSGFTANEYIPHCTANKRYRWGQHFTCGLWMPVQPATGHTEPAANFFPIDYVQTSNHT